MHSFCDKLLQCKKNIQFVNQNQDFFICMHHPFGMSINFSWIEEIAQHFSRAGIKNVLVRIRIMRQKLFMFLVMYKNFWELSETKTMSNEKERALENGDL